MGLDFTSNEEKEIAGIIKAVDFSRNNAAHKNKLWDELSATNQTSGARALSDDELDMIAAAGSATRERELLVTSDELLVKGKTKNPKGGTNNAE